MSKEDKGQEFTIEWAKKKFHNKRVPSVFEAWIVGVHQI